MSRADDVAQKIREAADHPEAPLLFAIGAERPAPQSAASEAYALGRTVQEEKLAKWVAVAKRDSQKLFGKPFLEALQDILKEGESEMEVRKGRDYFVEKSQPVFKKLVEDLLKCGIEFSSGSGRLDNLGTDCSFFFERRMDELTVTTRSRDGKTIVTFRSCAVRTHLDYPNPHFSDAGFPDLLLQVNDPRAMSAVKKFARAWEAKSRKLKDSREAKVTIFQNFA